MLDALTPVLVVELVMTNPRRLRRQVCEALVKVAETLEQESLTSLDAPGAPANCRR